MSVMGLFFISIFSFAMLWLARQGVFASHWLEEGEVAQHRPAPATEPPPAAKVGLAIFLAVAGCLFSLLSAAFFMRGDAPDWQMPPVPGVLWLNTAILAASSIALQLAVVAARRAEFERVKTALLISGATAGLFIIGQIWAWRELLELRFFASSNAPSCGAFMSGLLVEIAGPHGRRRRTSGKVRNYLLVHKCLLMHVTFRQLEVRKLVKPGACEKLLRAFDFLQHRDDQKARLKVAVESGLVSEAAAKEALKKQVDTFDHANGPFRSVVDLLAEAGAVSGEARPVLAKMLDGPCEFEGKCPNGAVVPNKPARSDWALSPSAESPVPT